MAAPSLADILPDFGAGRTQAAPRSRPGRAEAHIPVQPIPDISALVAEKVAEAEAAVTERLTSLYEATLEAERRTHEEELARLQKELTDQAAAIMAARFAEAQETLLALTASGVARILGPILTEEMQKRAVAALTGRIRETLEEREAVRLKAHGPQSLLEALAASLGRDFTGVEFVESHSFDLEVEIDGTIYQTRLSEWSAELAELLS